jgi:hypothetical protein
MQCVMQYSSEMYCEHCTDSSQCQEAHTSVRGWGRYTYVFGVDSVRPQI